MRILHLLAQRPERTGSGVYLQALLRHADKAGFDQRLIAGIPAEDNPPLDGIPPEHFYPVRFETPALPFPVAGMSDVMPYRSTRYSTFTPSMRDAYLAQFEQTLSRVRNEFKPDVIHSHHLWLLTALAATTSDTPVIASCHGTGLRQLALAPQLISHVVPGIRQTRRILSLTKRMSTEICRRFTVPQKQVIRVGAGYRHALFHPRTTDRQAAIERACITLERAIPKSGVLIGYAGKLSNAKGVPELLAAAEQLIPQSQIPLHFLLAGSGTGEEAEQIRRHANQWDQSIHLLGQIGQPALADLLRCCDIFVLPSYYEGLPLVTIEALACGCRLVTTDLPNIRELLPTAPAELVEWVELPQMESVDKPLSREKPAMVNRLFRALHRHIERVTQTDEPLQNQLNRQTGELVRPHTWDEVWQRIKKVYDEVAPDGVDGRRTG